MSFGNRLTALRKSAGITQAQLAEAVGSAQSTISQLEMGARRPSYDMLQAIARALNISTGYLVSGEIEGLNEEEEQHFREYRALSADARAELRTYARFLQERDRRPKGGSQ